MKRCLNFLRRLTIFEWLAVLVVISGLVFLSLFIFKKEKWTRVEIRVFPANWGWNSNSPYWLVDRVLKGDEQYDGLGRKIAEVLGVKNYEGGENFKTSYLTMNLKTEIDKRQRKLKFNHRPLEIGKPIDLEFARVGFQGMVIFIEGVPDNRIFEDKIVEVKINEWSDKFTETLGILPWKADAVRVGDQVKDNQGNILAEVLEKKSVPAEKIVTTSDGRVLLRQDPVKKDVFLVVRLRTSKQSGLNYFIEEFKVKVGSVILLSLPQIDILPEITKVIE